MTNYDAQAEQAVEDGRKLHDQIAGLPDATVIHDAVSFELEEPAHPDQPSKGQLALNGARLALAQLAVDAETLLNAWEERERLPDGHLERIHDPDRTLEYMAAKQEIARCRHELQQLLKLWEPK